MTQQGNAQKPASPPPEAPRGNRVLKSIGPGNLKAGAGKEARKTEKAIYCGRMSGLIDAIRQSPNRKDPERLSNCYIGQFLCVRADGEVVRTMELYLPSIVDGAYSAMAQRLQIGVQIPFAFELWAEPDEVSGMQTPQGYRYTVYDLMPPKQRDVLTELAVSAGMIEAPTGTEAPQITDQTEGREPEYDPDTGEVREEPVEQETQHKGRNRRAA